MTEDNIFRKFAQANQDIEFENINDDFESQVDGEISNPFEKQAKKNEEIKEYGFFDTLLDIGQQIATKGPSGFAGAYGNILDAFGLQPKEGYLKPGQEAKYSREFDILQQQKEGKPPSFSELMELSEDDIPNYSRLPTSKELQKKIETTTGIGEGKTPSGRIAGRGAEFLGEGVALPGSASGKALATLAGAGVAGQTARELGAPEGLASGIEIAGSIIPSMIQGKVIPKGDAKEIADFGRQIGLTEKQITPLIQGETKVATLSKVARKSESTKNLFSSIKDTLGNSYDNIKNSVKNFGRVGQQNERNLITKFTDIKTDLQRTLKASPDKESAIKFIEESIDKLQRNGATPEELINFWQDINKSVKWNSIQGGKKALARLKEPILETLENVTPVAAKDFEMTNKLYSKYAQISKKLKPDMVDALVSKGEILAIGPSGLALAYGNPWPLAGLATETAIRTLAEEMLTNPYFQNVATKLVTNFNQASVKGITQSVNQVKEYMQRKYPNEDWSFLMEG